MTLSAISPTRSSSRWAALALIVVAQFMVILDVAIVNVALPSIELDLGFSQSGLEWVVTAYAIVFGGFLLLGGRLADLVGRRRTFMAGIALFTAASVLCGLSWSAGSLVAFRGIQGLGGALLAPAGLSLLMTTFTEGRDRNLALGIWGAASGSGAAVAAIGTSLTDPLAKLLGSRPEITDDYLEFRQVVEGTAAELAARRATEIDLEVITRCMRRIESSHGKEDPVDEANADAELHIAIYEAAHNIVLLHVMRALSQMLRDGVFYSRDKLYSRRGVRDLRLGVARPASIGEIVRGLDGEAVRDVVVAVLRMHLDEGELGGGRIEVLGRDRVMQAGAVRSARGRHPLERNVRMH